jgi:hypothetical protein
MVQMNQNQKQQEFDLLLKDNVDQSLANYKEELFIAFEAVIAFNEQFVSTINPELPSFK